jgi:hypothetical protein
MERNADDLSGSAGGTGTGGSAGGYGNSGDVSGSSGYTAGGPDTGIADRARGVAGNAKDKLANVGSTVREQAGSAKDKLADALESGADKLRQRAGSGTQQFAGETGSTGVAVSGDNRVNQVSEKVAGGMQATADWLRDADLDSMRTGVERQVKEHPGRTLLIAVGLGYLLGKAFRK